MKEEKIIANNNKKLDNMDSDKIAGGTMLSFPVTGIGQRPINANAFFRCVKAPCNTNVTNKLDEK